MVELGETTSDKLFEALELAISCDAFKRMREGKPLDVFDIEDNEKLATMTKEIIEEGFASMINEFPHEFANLMTDMGNTEDADILFQLCCFCEVMYSLEP